MFERDEGRARWGQVDLAGGVSEFVLDPYDPEWYASDSAAGLDPLHFAPDPVTAQFRGSNFLAVEELQLRSRAAERFEPIARDERADTVGMRCARDL